MPTLRYWDVATGGFISASVGPQGSQGPAGIPGATGPGGVQGPPAFVRWTPMAGSYGTGWSDYLTGFRTGQYTKDGPGFVHLRGLVKWNASVAAGAQVATPVITLPSGYRPALRQLFQTVAYVWTTPGGPARIDVWADGTVNYLNSTTTATPATPWLSLSGVMFIADGS